MKYILSFVGIAIISCALFFCGGNKNNKQDINGDYMRIHITANSNTVTDQNLKYEIKDSVVDFLIPLLAYAEDKSQATEIIVKNIEKIQEISNNILKSAGVRYQAKVSVVQENIPARVYDGLVLEEGVYDCLKIDLGAAKGDNWWCVVFPAVCFLSSKNYENYVYVSKIWDIICSVTQKT